VKCVACEQPTETLTCQNCGHLNADIDSTGTLDLQLLAADSAVNEALGAVPAGHAALVVVKGPQIGEVWTLDAETVEIGRADDVGIFLDDITVSRHHALLRKSAGGWTVEDLGSLNGSYVNRNLISEVTSLTAGDEVQFGKFRFSFFAGDR